MAKQSLVFGSSVNLSLSGGMMMISDRGTSENTTRSLENTL